MIDFTDSIEFFVVYLIVSLSLLISVIFFYFSYSKKRKLVRLQVIIWILISILFVFYMVSSFSNLGGSQDLLRLTFKFIYSMVFLLLLGISACLFISKLNREDDNYYSEQEEDAEESEMEDREYINDDNSYTRAFEPNYEYTEKTDHIANQTTYDKELQELNDLVGNLYEKQTKGENSDDT